VVVLVPVVEPWSGSRVLPISLPSSVIGMEIDTGSAVSGPVGLLDGVLDGTTAGAAAGVAAGAEPVACATAADVALSTVCTVDCTAADTGSGGASAPAGVKPASAPAARISPDDATTMEVMRFRLKILLLLCVGNTDPL
jgi:hypothetical protein